MESDVNGGSFRRHWLQASTEVRTSWGFPRNVAWGGACPTGLGPLTFGVHHVKVDMALQEGASVQRAADYGALDHRSFTISICAGPRDVHVLVMMEDERHIFVIDEGLER